MLGHRTQRIVLNLVLLSTAPWACGETTDYARSLFFEDDDNNPSLGGGGPPGTSGPEDLGGASLILSFGQSPTQGVCSWQPGDLFPNCLPLNTAPLSGARMACWDSLTDTYSGTVPLDLDDSSCRRGLAELPMYGMAEMYLQLSGLPVVFTCNAGQQGTTIAELSDPSIHFDRLRNCVEAIRDDVTANYLAYGLTSPLSYLRLVKMMQCESDDISRNDNYTSEVLAWMDDLEGMVNTVLPHQTDLPQVVWYQCGNTLAQEETLGITQPQLVLAAAQRSNLHIGGQFGHINPELCGEPGNRCQMETAASTLHYAPRAYRHMGNKLGFEGWKAVYGQNPGGMTITSVTVNETSVQACWDVPVPPMVHETTICPTHSTSVQGFEFNNASGPLFNDEQYISNPQILSVTLDPNGTCLNFELDREPYANLTHLNVSNRGLVRNSNVPANGCRLRVPEVNLPGGENVGAWWTEWRDSETQAPPDPLSGTMASWMAIESYQITQGQQPPPDTGPGFITLDSTDKYIETPDVTPDVFGGAQRVTYVLWIDTNGSGDGDLMRKGNPNLDGFRLFFDNNPGAAGSRIQIQNGGVGNSSTPPDFSLAEDESDFRFYAIVVDGTQPLGNRVQHYLGSLTGQESCKKINDTEAGVFPSTFSDTTDALRVGNNLNSTATVRLREVAIWSDTAASEFELKQICQRGYIDIRTSVLGTPDYYFRPSCDDNPTTSNGIENLGTVTANFTGTNMVVGDLTIDNSSVCAAGFDGGVVDDAGSAPDSGAAPDPTVPNVASLRFDGVDDYITITDTDLLDLETDALICMVVRPLTNRVNDTIAGHWTTSNFQWRWWARNEGARFYVPTTLTSANSYLARESTEGWPYLHIAGSHQLLCARYDLSQPTVSDRIRMFRNGELITLPTFDIGPAINFGDVTSGGITLGCTGTGTECWAGDLDEFAVWVGVNVPTDTQIQDNVMIDANNWDCVFPNWNDGIAGVQPPNIWYRFEQDLTDEMGGPAASISGGSPVFSTDTVTCDGQYTLLSSLAPSGTNQSWSTNIMISTENSDRSMVVTATFDTAVTETGWIIGQWETPGAGENSWGIQQITDSIRVYVSPDANNVNTFVDFTGPVNIQDAGWNNLVVKFDLNQAVQADRVRVWLNGTEMTTKSINGTLPSSFVQVTGSETRVGETLAGGLDWGPNVAVSSIGIWRDSDTEPTVAQIESTFAVNSNVGDPLPNYSTAVPSIGCWFVLAGGDLTDRQGNCQDLTPNGGSVWSSTPNAPEPTTVP